MATNEEIRNKNIEESNELLSESISLAGQLADKMSFLYKQSKEKYTQDKISLDLTKQAVTLTKNLSSDYSSIKDVEKDIAKNKKLQNEVSRQQLALEKEIGDKGKQRIKFIQNQEKGLANSAKKLAELREKEAAGVTGAKKQADELARQMMTRQKSLLTQKQNLSTEERQYMLLGDTSKVLQQNADYLEEQQRKQENINKGMGFFGRAAGGAQKALAKIGAGEFGKKLGLEAAAEKAKEVSYRLTDGGKKSLGFFGKLRVATASFGAALKSALGPIALIGMIVSAYNKGKEAATRLNDETVSLSRTLGISQERASGIATQARAIGSAMGVTTGIATKAAESIYSSLDGVEQLSKSTLDTFIRLNVFAGMSSDSIAGIYKFSKLSGEAAEDTAEAIATTAQESIKSMKVNISQKAVMDGVAKTSNTMKLNFKGSAAELTKAFIQSKKLGLELNKVEDVANSLLNIEDSIAAEMEAELLTGKELNLEKAREAALNNDTATLMEEIANQFGSIEDFQKMNRVQQEAFAKSIGMSRDGLSDMLVSSKENAAENTDLLDTQKQGLAAMQSMASTSERLLAREEARANQFAKIFELLNPIVETFKELGPLVLEIITPIVETLAPILKDFVKDMLPSIKEQFKIIGQVIGELVVALKPVFEVLMEVGKIIMPIITDLFKLLAPIVVDLITHLKPVIALLANAAKDLLPIIADIFKQLIPIVADLIEQLMPIITEILDAIMPLLKPVLDIFVELARILIPFMIEGFKAIMPILKPILTLFKGIADIVSGILSGDWSKVKEGLINLIIGTFEYMLNMPIRGINVMLDFIPGFGPNTIPLIKLPTVKLAEGGIVTKPTNALIGEAGPEAVVPLNSDKSMNINTKALEAKIDKLIAVIERGGVVTLDGQKVGQALVLGSYKTQ